ncbi:MAG TPA: alpha/beta fold hydrolase [Gemmatimonadaceae bacterium]|nr:alpha/beta fold hydrolase [Gemmatimonadaceae bacterium]
MNSVAVVRRLAGPLLAEPMRRVPTHRAVPAALLVACAALATPGTARAQQSGGASSSMHFVVTAGADTVATEDYSRTATLVSTTMVNRPQALRYAVTLTLTPDATVSRVETTVRHASTASSSAPLQSAVLRFTGDSVLVTIGAQTTPSQRFAVPAGTLPFINLSSAIIEQILLRARALGGTAADVPLFVMAGGALVHATVRWVGADSAALGVGGVEIRARVSRDGRFLGGVVPSQHVRFMRVASAAPPPPPPAPPDYSAPPGAPYTAEEVHVPDPKAGITLAGTLTVPRHSTDARVGAVVMITGSGAEDRDESLPGMNGYRPFRQIADTLGRRGIAVLRLDDRGVGGSGAGPAGATSADFVNDIRAALAYLRTRPEIDSSRLGLVGHSEGGMIAPMVAASDTRLRGIVLLAGPAYTGRRILEYQLGRNIAQGAGHSPARRDSARARVDSTIDKLAATNAWARYFIAYDPIPTARRVRTPVLILQGATDQQVTPEQAPKLAAAFRAAGNRDVTMKIFPNTDHLFLADSSGNPARYAALPSKRVRPEVLGAIADWLVAHLR